MAVTSSSSYYIYTPAGIQIEIEYGTGTDGYSYNISNYTGATLLVDIATDTFNCHTFAWYYQGDLYAYIAETQFNINDPTPYVGNPSNTCYSIIYSDEYLTDTIASNLQVGDIILYKYSDTTYIFDNEIKHSAMVVQTGSTTTSVRIKSKWGKGQIVESDLVHHPFYTPAIGDKLLSYPGDFVCVYRHNSNHTSTCLISYNDYTHTYGCYYCGRSLITNNHTFGAYSSSNTYHWHTCSVCSQTIYGQHYANTYTINPITHIGTCNVCGSYFEEPHDFVYYEMKYHCSKCGYETKHPLYPNKQEETENEKIA
ncbi:MAG: hypothetical protein IK048_03220 [Clostridia bacterium]|nr:hypothetical protein [Clostridia bacterium]